VEYTLLSNCRFPESGPQCFPLRGVGGGPWFHTNPPIHYLWP
jgi:hypothetical protein